MPRDGSVTRDRLLDVAERLVIDNGFAATSVDQVIAAAQSSKGAFFHHFSSKRDLAQQLVERYANADIAHLHLALDATADVVDPGQRLLDFIEYFERGADELMSSQSSCLYVAVLTERQLATDETAVPISRAVVAWREALTTLIDDALDVGHGLDTAALADHVFVTFEGAFILCRTDDDPGQMRRQLGVLRQLFAGLLGARVSRKS